MHIPTLFGGLLEWKRYRDIVAAGYHHARQSLVTEPEGKLGAFAGQLKPTQASNVGTPAASSLVRAEMGS